VAISFVGSLPPIGANNGGNVTLTFSNLVDTAGAAASLQQNDIVIAAFAHSSTSDAAMSPPSGWTEILEDYGNGTTYDANLIVCYKVMGASPDTSVTFTGPGGASFGTIGAAIAFRGVDTTTPLDVSAVGDRGTGTSTPNPPAITPSTAGAWPVAVGAGSAAAGAAYTAGTNLSSTTNHFRSLNHAETNDIAIGIGINTTWSSGSLDPGAWGGGNSNAANSWAAITLALRPAALTLAGTGGSTFGSASALFQDKALDGTGAAAFGSTSVLVLDVGLSGSGASAFGATADLTIESGGGDLVFEGSGASAFGAVAALSVDKTLSALGASLFASTSALAVDKALSGSGAAVFADAALLSLDKALSGAGGAVLGGQAGLAIEKRLTGTGAAVFGGTGTLFEEGAQDLFFEGSGAAAFNGSAALALDLGVQGAGAVVLSGTVGIAHELGFAGSGSIVWGAAVSLIIDDGSALPAARITRARGGFGNTSASRLSTTSAYGPYALTSYAQKKQDE
jgi:hypothetical protein